jgi:hypothetical protein
MPLLLGKFLRCWCLLRHDSVVAIESSEALGVVTARKHAYPRSFLRNLAHPCSHANFCSTAPTTEFWH